MQLALRINGEPCVLEGPLTVAEWVSRQGYVGKRIAVERNGEIVPRSQHPETLLQSGDQLEIVVAVGGG